MRTHRGSPGCNSFELEGKGGFCLRFLCVGATAFMLASMCLAQSGDWSAVRALSPGEQIKVAVQNGSVLPPQVVGAKCTRSKLQRILIQTTGRIHDNQSARLFCDPDHKAPSAPQTA